MPTFIFPFVRLFSGFHPYVSLSLYLALCFHDARVVLIQSMLPASGKVALSLCLMFIVLILHVKRKQQTNENPFLCHVLFHRQHCFLSKFSLVYLFAPYSILNSPRGPDKHIEHLRSTRPCCLFFLVVILLNKFTDRNVTSCVRTMGSGGTFLE